jgi:hypothetical protein
MGKRHDELEACALYARLPAQSLSQFLVPAYQRIPFELLLVHAEGDVHQAPGIKSNA